MPRLARAEKAQRIMDLLDELYPEIPIRSTIRIRSHCWWRCCSPPRPPT